MRTAPLTRSARFVDRHDESDELMVLQRGLHQLQVLIYRQKIYSEFKLTIAFYVI